MKIRHFLAIGLLSTLASGVYALDPAVDEPYVTFNAYVTKPDVWLKSSVYDDEVFFQLDNNPIQSARITKGIDQLQNFVLGDGKTTGSVVKIWASNKMWFINMDDMKVDGLTFGKNGKRGIKELRCQNNKLTDFNFVKDLRALEYLVAGGNVVMKNAVIESESLQRLDLGRTLYYNPNLETFSINAPKLLEIALAKTKVTEVTGLDKCTQIMEINISGNTKLTKLPLPKSENLEVLQILNNTQLGEITVRDYPKLRICNLINNALTKIDVANIPSVYHLNLANNKFEEMTMNIPTGGQGGITFTLNGNPIRKMSLDMPYCTEFVYQTCQTMDTLDLTGLPRLRRCDVKGGKLQYVNFNTAALDTCLRDFHLTYNRMALDAFPGIVPKMNPALNYYAPQAKPQIPAEAIAGSEIDLSHWAVGKNYDGTTTPSVFRWVTIFDEELQEGKDYIVKSPGVFQFPNVIEDKFRCFITNSAYPRFELWTDSEGRQYDWRIYTGYISIVKNPSGITAVGTDSDEAAEYYSLQGLRVPQPVKGQIYIVRKGDKTVKVKY